MSFLGQRGAEICSPELELPYFQSNRVMLPENKKPMASRTSVDNEEITEPTFGRPLPRLEKLSSLCKLLRFWS